MKKINIFSFLLVLITLFSCDPIEDRNELTGSLSPDEIKISVTVDGNNIYLENQTPGILPYWDYGTGFSNKNKETVYQPFAGEHTIKFTAYGVGLKGTTVERKVTVKNNDLEYFKNPDSWNLLTANGAGKTWVWDINKPNGKLWGNGSEMMNDVEWWGPSIADLTKDGVIYDELTFDLKGAANYTFVHKSADGSNVISTEKGFFKTFTTTYQNKTFNQVQIIGAGMPKTTTPGTLDIVKLTNDELVLRQRFSGYAWIYFFKAKN
jgi:hypothetical protein